MSLISLAQENNLPEQQFMDTETLAWIIRNKPDFFIKETSLSLSNDEINLIKKYTPSCDWFLSIDRFNSLHGVRHSIRVAAYSLKLKKEINIALIIAAMLHDIRRINDKTDPYHGKRGATWFLDNMSEITKKFRIKLNNYDIKEIHDMILYHDSQADDIKNNIFNHIDTLKTADALDRYCQPKSKWWINDDYLKLKPSQDMKFFSYNLVVNSEKLAIKGFDGIKSVFCALNNNYES